MYKIGVTNRPVLLRLREIPYPCTLLWHKPYLFGFIALDEEKLILKKYQKYRYKGKKLYRGATEMFTRDILGKDLQISC